MSSHLTRTYLKVILCTSFFKHYWPAFEATSNFAWIHSSDKESCKRRIGWLLKKAKVSHPYHFTMTGATPSCMIVTSWLCSTCWTYFDNAAIFLTCLEWKFKYKAPQSKVCSPLLNTEMRKTSKYPIDSVWGTPTWYGVFQNTCSFRMYILFSKSAVFLRSRLRRLRDTLCS